MFFSKSKKNLKKFKLDFHSAIQALKTNDAFFKEIYKDILEEIGEITQARVDEILSKIPQKKHQFSNVCDKLISMSKENICLTDNQQILKTIKETEFSSDTKERISRDSMEVLPVLGEYFRLYEDLYTNVYDKLLTAKLYTVNSLAFGFMVETEADYVTPEDFEKRKQVGYKNVFYYYNDLADQTIRRVLKLPQSFDVRNSKKKDVVELVEAAYNDDESTNTFVDIWFKKMRAIGKKYSEAHLDLYHYFKDTDAKMNAHIEWFSINYFMLPVDGILYLKKYTEEECNRILKLYQDGKIKGRNSFMN